MAGPWTEYQEAPQPQESGPWSDYSVGKGDSYYQADAVQEDSEWDNFWYSFHKIRSLPEALDDYIDTKMPMGRLQIFDPATGDLDIQYRPPSEELKQAVKEGDEEKAQAIINFEREGRLKQRFGHLYSPEGEAPEGDIAGTIVGAFADPTTLIPIAQGVKLGIATGAALGAIDGYLYSRAEGEGVADPTHVALGATIGGAAVGAFKGIGHGFSKAKTKIAQKNANKLLNEYEKRYTQALAKGTSKDIADVQAKELSGIYANGVEIGDLYKATGRTAPDLPTTAAAQDALESVMDEAGKNWLQRGVLKLGEMVEPYIGTTSTGIRGLSNRIFHQVRKIDMQSHVDVHNYFVRTENFAKKLNELASLDKGAYRSLTKSLYTGDSSGTAAIIKKLEKDPRFYGFKEDLKEVRKVLDELYDGYKAQGYKLKKEKDFFPRIVKNPEGLGVVRQSIIKKALSDAAKRKKRDLTKKETADVINSLIRRGIRDEATAKVSKSVRARKFEFLDNAMLPHYAEPNDSLHAYIRQAVGDINRRKFLSTHGVSVKSKNGVDPKGRDLEWGLGKLVDKESDRLGLSPEESDRLLTYLRARFGKGEQASSMGWQHFKNIGYGTTLGNIYSAITQLGDQAFGMYLNGIRNHLKGVFGPKLVRKTDIGLSDISEDLVNDVSKTKKFLDFTLKWSGFSRMDTFGKESLLNGALRKYKSQVSTDAGRRQFVAKWGQYFEGDTGTLMSKLKKGEFDDDNVRLLLWHTLSDVQPIGLSEMPVKYLNHPNGRVFYMLKTFTIKQFDLMRREILQDYSKGFKLKAAKNAARFAILFGLINGTADGFKDILSGRDFEVDDLMVDNLIKLVGVSRYQTSQMSKDGPVQVLLETLLPPVPFIDKPAQAILQDKPWKAFEPVPIVGKAASRLLGE